MRQYAEWLGRLWPERFEFTAGSGSLWTCWDRVRCARLHDANDVVFWAFWGPLAEELGVDPLDMLEDDGGWITGTSLLCALAIAVVQKVRETRTEVPQP